MIGKMDTRKGVRICIPHECDFEDLVEYGPNGYCKTVYVPLCDDCRKRSTTWNVGKINQFTGNDSISIHK